MKKIIVHPGFHKTGTKSIQTTLRHNRELLGRYTEVFLKDDISLLTDAARSFTLQPTPIRLQNFRSAADAFFSDLTDDSDLSAVVSSEDLSGLMPGRRGVETYQAVPDLMSTLEQSAYQTFGDRLDLTIFFSTRNAHSWLNSLWWQHLRSTRICTDFDDYVGKAADAAELNAIVDATTVSVKRAKIERMSLDDSKLMPEGPITPLLDLLGIPGDSRKSLTFGDPENSRPAGELEPIFLALNRSQLSDDVVSRTKKQLMRAAHNM